MENIQQAIKDIERFHTEIPFDAISYLYDHESNPTIHENITHALKNAYNDDVYSDSLTPLWYAIVAENHLTKDYIDLVVNLFTATDKELKWMYMVLQAQVLVELLSRKYPAEMGEKCLTTIEKYQSRGNSFPYYYLYSCLYYVDARDHKSLLLKLLKRQEDVGLDIIIHQLCRQEFYEAVPMIQEKIEDVKAEDKKRRLNHYLNVLLGKEEFDDTGTYPFYVLRGDWKSHYEKLSEYFGEDDDLDDDL